jgi:hypothetical protein
MSWCQLARGIVGCFATALRHALSAAALLAGARHGGHQDRPYSLVAASPGWKAARARLASPAGRMPARSGCQWQGTYFSGSGQTPS